jgi:hypothetical protein
VDFIMRIARRAMYKGVQSHLLSDPTKVEGETYDYVIAGGGLTGLTVAARTVR